MYRAAPFLGYFLAQGFMVAGLVTSRFPDSSGYFDLSFTGQYERLWTVPLFYKILLNDATRVLAQVVLATCAWWILAKVASRMARDHRVRLGLRLVLLALGLVGPIASWNSTILSDSAAISLTALLISCWLSYLQRPTWRSVIGVVLITLFWTFTRNDLVIVGLGITIFVVIATLWKRRDLMNIVLAAALVLISAYGLEIDGRDPFVADANLADVIEGRVLANPAWTNWFVAHGMPYSAAIQGTEGGTYGGGLMAMPSFVTWLTAKRSRTYVEFMIANPDYTVMGPLPDFSGELASVNVVNRTPYIYTQLNPTPSMISPDANYGRHRDILPSVIEDLLFEQGQIGDVMTLAFLAFGLAFVAARRYGADKRLWVPVLAALSAIPQGYLVWLTGGDGETDRHAIVLAVTVRIGLWILAGFALDQILTARRAKASTPSQPPL